MTTRLPQFRPPGAARPRPGIGLGLPEAAGPASRPPARVVVRSGSIVIADSTSAWRVMETSHPPTWYLPRTDISEQYVRRSAAREFGVRMEGRRDVLGCRRRGSGHPGRRLELRDADAAVRADHRVPVVHAGAIECFIDGERVLPQAGGFYGGWITADVVGPFKGEPGSWGW